MIIISKYDIKSVKISVTTNIDSNMKEICKNILIVFTDKYNNNIAQEINKLFIKHYKMMILDDFDEGIKDDVIDFENSQLLDDIEKIYFKMIQHIILIKKIKKCIENKII